MTHRILRGDAPETEKTMDYRGFLATKAQLGSMGGFAPSYMPNFLFDFQAALVDWAVRKGRAAIFADCGLGKTPMQLVWAQNVVERTNKSVLVLTPLAVTSQTIREAEKFNIWAWHSKDGTIHKGINVANYERLHYFSPDDFAGVVLDESSILKSFDGVRRAQITEFMRRVPYRLLCTATAAPNDYIELGTSAEALGEMGYTDMLSRFFVNDQHTIRPMRYTGFGAPRSSMPSNGERTDKWRFKGHAQEAFWRWIASWARAMRKPSDMGFDDSTFVLPPYVERETVVKAHIPRPGMLFDVAAVGLSEEREVRRRTLAERCEAAAAKVKGTGQPAVIWCHLNDEGDTLASMIQDATQVSGADSDESKEDKFEAFRMGQARALIIKPKIGAWGLNWQHCAHVVYFPSDSYEQYYQAVRRCWRFGQTKPVVVDLIHVDGQERMLANLQRKAKAADDMFTALMGHMNNALAIDSKRAFEKELEVPSWL